MDRSRERLATLIACLTLIIVTAGVYWPVAKNGFINFDDPDYVEKNPRVQAGLTAATVEWAFTSYHSSNWHPVTWLSHALDCELFGLKPAGHHAMSVGFHVLNAVLLLLLLRRMTGQLWPSALVAGLFALHPLHVESVAWISERKDVLSTLFFLLTVWCYTVYARSGNGSERSVRTSSGWRRAGSYAAGLVFFALGLMSKPMVVTLPFVLLLLDLWPLRRLTPVPGRRLPPGLWPLVLEKTPFFALSIASSIVTFAVQRASGAVVALDNSSFETRLANAVLAYGKYLEKTFLPRDLAVFYPYTPVDMGAPAVWGAGILLLGISLGAVISLKKRPWAFVGWFWFIGTMVPVIGLVQVGRQSMADRYTYLPHIGLFILLAWSLHEMIIRFRPARNLVPAGSVLALMGCAFITARQVPLWKDSKTLFAHAAQVTENNFIAHGVIANTLLEEGKLEQALEQVTLSLSINPGYPEGHSTLGHIHAKRNEYDLAIASYREALRLDPGFGDVYASLADALIKKGSFVEAEAQAREAIRLAPLSLPARFAFANALHQQNKLPEAIEAYRKLLEMDPTLFAPRRYLGNALFSIGRSEEAVKELAKALEARNKDVETMLALGIVQLELGHITEAETSFENCLLQAPANPIAHYHIAGIRQTRKKYVDAVSHYEQALAGAPDWAEALNNLAWLLATCPDPSIRNGKRAVELSERAVMLTAEKIPMFLGTLAAACAEAGRYGDAVSTAEKARTLAQSSGQPELASRNQQLLELYRSRKAYHEPQ